MTQEINSNPNDKWWVAAIIVLALLWFVNAFWSPARAQKLDTIQINHTNIQKIVQKSTAKSIRYYAVYEDGTFSDIIPIGKTVIEYLETCKEYNLRPQLGIKLKDGQIVSIVRYKRTFKKQKNGTTSSR